MTYDKVFNNDYPPMENSPEKLKQQEGEEPLLIVRVDKGQEPLVSIADPYKCRHCSSFYCRVLLLNLMLLVIY